MFAAVQPPSKGPAAEEPYVLPGICTGESAELMLCISNDAFDTMSIETGDIMAVARKLPPGSELHRKFSPEAAPAAERVILIGDDSQGSKVETEPVLTPLPLEVPNMPTTESTCIPCLFCLIHGSRTRSCGRLLSGLSMHC